MIKRKQHYHNHDIFLLGIAVQNVFIRKIAVSMTITVTKQAHVKRGNEVLDLPKDQLHTLKHMSKDVTFLRVNQIQIDH